MSVLQLENDKRLLTLIMVYGGIQLEPCLTNDISGSPELGPKDELVGYSADACGGLRFAMLFATHVYQSTRLIQIDSVRDEIIIVGNELCWSSFYLVKRNDVRTL